MPPIKYRAVYTDLDQLSNSVVDLINQKKLDKAEAVSRRLLSEYPDQVDGFDRLAMVYEARGDRKKAAKYSGLFPAGTHRRWSIFLAAV